MKVLDAILTSKDVSNVLTLSGLAIVFTCIHAGHVITPLGHSVRMYSSNQSYLHNECSYYNQLCFILLRKPIQDVLVLKLFQISSNLVSLKIFLRSLGD